MPTMVFAGRWLGILMALLSMGGLVGIAQQPPGVGPVDPLKEALNLQKIADQKARLAVEEAINLAQRYARNNPAKAIQILQAAQSDLEASPAISPATRRQLSELLQQAQSRVRSGGYAGRTEVPGSGNARDQRDKQQQAYERWLAEVKDVQEAIERIARLQQAGQQEAAQQQIVDLLRRYPDNPAVLLLVEKDRLAQGVQEAQTFARLQAERLAAVQRDVLRSSLPPLRDIEFPKDWKQKTERRLQTVRLTDREKKINEALDKP
ncbi:MAG: hypothetical protein NZ703_14310, partial [Gemmataceae bacterium]|nr:hypothetical protein [Gemmataceae bacterium]